jgi:galactose mutarotase-like enzyme
MGGWAAKLFGDVGVQGRVSLTDPRKGERLEFVVPPEEVPQVGIWINCRGWAPRGRTPYYNLALEPCIGAPDRLDTAAEDWKTAQTLGPGEERRWSLEVRLPD